MVAYLLYTNNLLFSPYPMDFKYHKIIYFSGLYQQHYNKVQNDPT